MVQLRSDPEFFLLLKGDCLFPSWAVIVSALTPSLECEVHQVERAPGAYIVFLASAHFWNRRWGRCFAAPVLVR